MIKEMEKALKRYLKGKNRITMGVVVAFLLGSSFAFGDVTVKYEDSTIKILDNSGTITEIGTVTKNSDDEFTWTLPEGANITETVKIDDTVNTNNIKVNIVNSGTISSSGNGNYIGNGISSYSNSDSNTIGDITNSGSIRGNSTGGGKSGNGIFSDSDTLNSIIGNITNSGSISGNSTVEAHSGNGIYSYSDTSNSIIGNIKNNGNINGSTTGSGNKSGNGIYSYSDSASTIGDITNSGSIRGNSTGGDSSGNGIYSYSDSDGSTIGDITNSGSIRGNSTGGDKSGNGIYSYSETGASTIEDITNRGSISGNSTGGNDSGNGIYSYSKPSSTIGNITNSGTISGSTTGNGDKSGNGIFSYSKTGASTIGDIINSGTISGSTTGIGNYSGNGIYSTSSESIIGNIINYGIISGKSTSGSESENGIYSYSFRDDSISKSKIGNITNYGTISGNGRNVYSGNGIYSSSSTNLSSTSSKIGKITNYGIISGSTTGSGNYSGNGVFSSSSSGSSIIESISNTGVIMGSNNGIYIKGDSSSKIDKYSNYGLVIGQTPVKIEGGGTVNTLKEQGMAITLDGSGDITSIASGTGGSTGIYSIVNTQLRDNSGSAVSSGAVDSYDVYTSDQSISDTIINGAGVNSGTVTIEADKNFSLNGGVVNAYKTAVTVKDGASFTGTDVTINGGGLDGNTVVISGSAGANTVNISGNSFINGKVDLGDGDDILFIGNSTQINGDIDGGTGNGDILNFGSAVSRAVGNDNINLFHKISNMENININQKVTAFETSEITGAKDINIGKNGEFVLRIDTSKVDNTSGTDKITGHALYGNIGTISSTGGKLLLALNGVGNESIISFGNTQLDSSLVTGDEGKYQEDITLDTTSLLHSVGKIDLSNNEIKITAKSNLPTKPINPDNITYEKLNKIYHGILSVDKLENFNVDTDEKLSSFMGYLNDIYAGNPYSYSSELSRKSMGMFRDIVTENLFKADTGKWMIYGGLTHIDGGTKDTYYGKGYYTYDIGSSDIDADTKITGAYMLGEYGVSDTLTSGVIIGGNKLKSDLSNGSKVDGSAMYLGAYAKKYIGNLKVTAGLGFQYGDYDADRTAAGREITETRSYSSSYSDLTYDIYLNGRYSHNIRENLFLEPYGTLSYTYVDQDGADEGNKTLAIETDSKSFDYTSAKVGLDLKKVIPHEKGKSTLSVGASYTRLLNGADEEYITGRFKGGSNFDILVAHKNEHSLGLNAKYTLELENGILFDVKGTYSVERDSHNQSGKNKTKGEWIVGTGLGYKF
ncbi:autotransporter [Fusobacterium varium]|nr:autotransporter [Fusobacterium varium]